MTDGKALVHYLQALPNCEPPTQVIHSANPKTRRRLCSDSCKATLSPCPLSTTYWHSIGLAWHWDLLKGSTFFSFLVSILVFLRRLKFPTVTQ